MPEAIKAYLTFNGNCREAMKFYKRCLGGELQFQTLGESPNTEEMPEQMKHYIVHASLTGETFQLMGSDLVWDEGLVKGNNVSIYFSCANEAQLKEIYGRLSEESIATEPAQENENGDWTGSLTDKYGNHWLLHSH